MFNLKQRVKILCGKKLNDSSSQHKEHLSFHIGVIVGIELCEDQKNLGNSMTEKEYINHFSIPKYKIAYVEHGSKKAYCNWYFPDDIEEFKHSKENIINGNRI